MTNEKQYKYAVMDMGNSGIWFKILARSSKEIEDKYPSLKVFGTSLPDHLKFVGLHQRDYFELDIDDDAPKIHPTILKDMKSTLWCDKDR